MGRIRHSVVAAAGAILACAAAAGDYRIETVAEGLDHPWSLAFLPDGRMLVTERAGRLRVIAGGALRPEPVAGVPPAYVASQGGLFEVLPDPDFESNGRLYLTLAHGGPDANATRLVRGRLADGRLRDVEVLFTAQPAKDTPVHYGGRMAWLPDGTLALGLGDGFDYREAAQKRDNHLGTIVRLNADGSTPADNPVVGEPGARDEILSYGHRNIQGLVYDRGRGVLWAHEHGPRGGDELNRIRAGANYGWPLATHGVDYNGALVSPYTSRPGTEPPVVHWTPSVAPAGMALYEGDLFPEWRGDLLVSTLVEQSVRRLVIENGAVVRQEVLFRGLGERIRDVRVGPDGAVWLLTDAADGRVLRVTPAGE